MLSEDILLSITYLVYSPFDSPRISQVFLGNYDTATETNMGRINLIDF
jgi:hypothetical protein